MLFERHQTVICPTTLATEVQLSGSQNSVAYSDHFFLTNAILPAILIMENTLKIN